MGERGARVPKRVREPHLQPPLACALPDGQIAPPKGCVFMEAASELVPPGCPERAVPTEQGQLLNHVVSIPAEGPLALSPTPSWLPLAPARMWAGAGSFGVGRAGRAAPGPEPGRQGVPFSMVGDVCSDSLIFTLKGGPGVPLGQPLPSLLPSGAHASHPGLSSAGSVLLLRPNQLDAKMLCGPRLRLSGLCEDRGQESWPRPGDCRSILLFVPCGCVLFLSLLFAWDRRGCICWGVAAYRAQGPC